MHNSHTHSCNTHTHSHTLTYSHTHAQNSDTSLHTLMHTRPSSETRVLPPNHRSLLCGPQAPSALCKCLMSALKSSCLGIPPSPKSPGKATRAGHPNTHLHKERPDAPSQPHTVSKVPPCSPERGTGARIVHTGAGTSRPVPTVAASVYMSRVKDRV